MVFGFFKKDDSAKAVELTSHYFISLIKIRNQGYTFVEDKWVLGYMWGFHHAVCQSLGANNPVQPIKESYRKIFPKEEWSMVVLKKSYEMTHEPVFIEGESSGALDAIQYVTEGKHPVQLSNRWNIEY